MTDHSADQRRAQIAERTGAATPGPWEQPHSPPGCLVSTATDAVASTMRLPDAVFIAHARDDVGWLLDQLTAADKREEGLREALKRIGWDAGMRRLSGKSALEARTALATFPADGGSGTSAGEDGE